MNHLRRLLIPALLLFVAISAFSSAYNARPKLVVVIVVDQLRGDMIERYHDQFVDGGFRLLMDRGAWFSSCYYNYAFFCFGLCPACLIFTSIVVVVLLCVVF